MSNLLEKASILTTPTAYDDGKILSVKPAPSLGVEKIVNGTFDENVNGWITNNENATFVWQINKTALFTSSSFAYVRVSPALNLNAAVYKVSFDILSFEGNLSNVHIGLGTAGNVITTTGSYTYFYTSTGGSTEFQIRPNSGGTGSITIDNVSVKEVIDGDFDFTRGSSATRVNAQGLVEDVQILSSNLVQNGDFSQEGSELVTNGSFDTDTDWSKGASWSIADGKASSNGLSNNSLSQTTPILEVGKTYKLKIDITHISGTLLLLGAYYETQISFTESGSYDIFIVPKVTTFSVYASSFIGSIDNVSVKEVGQDWTFGTGWSIGDGVANAVDAAFNSQLVYSDNVVANTKYKISFDVSNYVKGNVRVNIGNVGSDTVSSNGNFTFVLTSANVSPLIIQSWAGGSGTSLSITNLSVIEITEDTNLPRINYTNFDYEDVLGDELVTNGNFDTDSDWIKQSSWSIANGSANCDGSGGFRSISQSALTNQVGKTYKISYEVSNYVSGEVRFILGGLNLGQIISANGVHTETIQAVNPSTNSFIYIETRGSGFIGSIDNVSVKELTEDVVVPYSGEGSLLLEPQRTNLLVRSNDYSSNWVITGTGSSIGGSVTGISQDINGTSLTLASGGLFYSSITSISNGVISIYMRVPSGTVDLRLGDPAGSPYETKTLTTTWQRFSVVDIGSLGGLAVYNSISGTTITIEVCAAQLEEGSYPTSYIPTNGSTVTRLADVCNNSGNSDLINSTEGVLYWEGAKLHTTSGTQVLGLSDGSGANRISFQTGTVANQLRFVVDSGGNQASYYHILSDITDFNKVALKWKQDDFSFWVNGVKVATDTSGNVPPLNFLNTLDFYYGTGIFNFTAKTKCVAVFKEALTDEELTCLTTI